MTRRLNPAYFITFAAILTASWPDGTVTHDPVTTMPVCLEATASYVAGRANYPGKENQRAITATCVPSDPLSAGFKPGWDTIRGYNNK